MGDQKKIPPACIVPYRISKGTIKNRVVLTTHMFSFLTEGSKEIVMGNAAVKLDKKDFVLVTAGKCFMSEILSDEGNYACTLLFFDHVLLQTFFELQKTKIQDTELVMPQRIYCLKAQSKAKPILAREVMADPARQRVINRINMLLQYTH